jgi:HlyD family secretion protein
MMEIWRLPPIETTYLIYPHGEKNCMRYDRLTTTLVAAVIALTALPVLAEDTKSADQTAKKADANGDEKNEAAETKKPAVATHEVKKGPMKIELALDGVFEASVMEEIFVRSKAWSTLHVLSAAKHGQRVKQGDLLVAFDPEKIDQAISDARSAQELGRISVAQAELALNTAQQSYPLNWALVEKQRRVAMEDLDSYLKVAKPFNKKMAEFNLEMSKFYLEYAEEELRQLEKMYKADDLTEETEEIVLKRAKRQVDSARMSHERAKISHELMMKYDMPRQEEGMRTTARQSEIVWQREKVGMPQAMRKQQLEFEKLRLERARADQKLEELMADRQLLTVKSPVEGIVYYGQCVEGKWTGGAAVAKKLRRGGSVLPNEVFMTVVKPRPLILRVAVPEKELAKVTTGVQGTIAATALPDAKIAATVKAVSPIPAESGAFLAEVLVSGSEGADGVMPGMNGKLTLVLYDKADAITIPPAALQTDPDDKDKTFVKVVGKDGKTKKRPVTVGRKTDNKVEILKGLKPGEKVELGEKK